MGTVNVAQFDRLAKDSNGIGMQVPVAPMSSENITSSATSAQSTVFDPECSFIRISTDTTVRIAFGSNPTATATGFRLPADVTEYFGVTAGQKVAVIDE